MDAPPIPATKGRSVGTGDRRDPTKGVTERVPSTHHPTEPRAHRRLQSEPPPITIGGGFVVFLRIMAPPLGLCRARAVAAVSLWERRAGSGSAKAGWVTASNRVAVGLRSLNAGVVHAARLIGPEEHGMVATLVALGQLLRTLGRAIADPATRGLVVLTVLILTLGTLFYRSAEGWSTLDALYFSVVTLTTIGFGDLAPTGDGAKLFTIIYSLLGIGILASFVTSLAVFARQDRDDRHGPLRRRSRRRRAEDEPSP
jgi:voltage-gated potassium channel